MVRPNPSEGRVAGLKSIRVVVVVLLALAVSLQACALSHSSDADLIRNLHDHKAEFNRLVTLFQTAGGLAMVDVNTAYWGGRNVPTSRTARRQRVSECRRLLEKLGLPDGIDRSWDVTWITTSTVGLAVSGSAKGYAYADKPPGELVRSLDDYQSDQGGPVEVFRHVEGKWYLFYSYDP
jgi:hypothetical protein